MVKAKKGRRPPYKDETESDTEDEAPTSSVQDDDKNSKEKAKKSKSKTPLSDEEDANSAKNSKKKGDNKKIADISKDLKKVNINPKKNAKKKVSSDESDSGSDSENDAKPVKAKPAPNRGGFAMLQMDDSESSDQKSEDESSESEEEKPKKTVQKKTSKETQKEAAQKESKKGKKSKKKKDDSDEDIDQVLAELQIEYSSKKPPPSKKDASDVEKTDDALAEDTEVSAAKTAAQKKKEKKLKQLAAKKEASQKEPTPDAEETVAKPSQEKPIEEAESIDQTAEETTGDNAAEGDKKKKKKKVEKVVEEKTKKGPAKKTIAAMQEALKKLKEDEERLKREEEERIRLEEEQEEQRLELLRLEKEKKDKKKKKEKERMERLKAEGKFLTAKQKAEKARQLAMVESLKGQGFEIKADQPKKARLGTRIRPNKLKKQTSEEQQSSVQEETAVTEKPTAVRKTEAVTKKVEDTEIKDWDAESAGSDAESKPSTKAPVKKVAQVVAKPKEEPQKESESSEEDESESEDESASENEEEQKTAAIAREKALIRIKKREEENEAKKSTSSMRAAVVCVLGHVDTGKTKILDKLRRTNVQDGEAGGITQQIGATNVPIENIKDQTRHVKGVNLIEFKIPGLLIIDTPGHESFSNLRSRGSSLCDIAILVVDIMHGLEPQTIESLNLLKARKTPFIVALNKIDRLYDWQSAQRKDVKDIIKAQHTNTQSEFETRTKEVILQFAEQGLNAALFYENPDVRTYVSLVPTSAVTGEGMGNLLTMIIQSCENLLHKRLLFSHTLQATVLEVKAISGLGMTIDCILINGILREGDTVVLAGTDGPIVTQIRSLLMPQPMKELRVKNAYIEHKEVIAAQGIKITAKDLEKAVAGLNLQVAHKPDEIDVLKEQVSKELKSALSSIKLSDRGVYVQASTLGSLEALLEFLKGSKIPYSAIRIGPVVKRDVMKASAMLEHEPQYAVILAFDVKVERDAQEMADSVGVTIFQADIIYHLFDKFMSHREALKKRKREEFKHIAVFPCRLKILPQFVFNSRDPIVMGVIVEAGILKEGTPICVPSKEFVDIGIVTSLEVSHKQVETARKGMEVCVKIDPIPGESPKMFGRHFDETDFLVSKISRPSIDACKDYFRDDLLKTDWQLMVELKNQFQIL